MSLKHGILGLLNYSPMTGYDLSKIFKDSLAFFWDAKTSQIYRELGTMESSGWLCSECIAQTEKPNKRIYSITDRGKDELLDWLSFPGPDIDAAMNAKAAFLIRVFLGGEMGKERVIEMLRAYHDKCMERCVEINAISKSLIPGNNNDESVENADYWRLTALYGEIIHKARIEWADRAISMLEKKPSGENPSPLEKSPEEAPIDNKRK